ncbi:MAG: cupin domain-containing protein [Acidimicrobiia bacterium]
MPLQSKSLDEPDQVRTFGHGRAEIVEVGDVALQRATFAPGWKWSQDIKPNVGTDTCQVHHVGYVIAGKLHVEMDDGSHTDLGPGDAVDISPGHDAWVLGNDACVMLDWGPGAVGYATPAS